MSTPYAKLPGWADYGLIPLINLLVAFIMAGLVVLLVGENPLRAAVILVDGAFGSGQNIRRSDCHTQLPVQVFRQVRSRRQKLFKSGFVITSDFDFAGGSRCHRDDVGAGRAFYSTLHYIVARHVNIL